jgi:hypothetical protein
VRVGIVALALWLALATAADAQSVPPTDDAQHVVDAFELARGAGDIDGALAQLSDTAVITVQTKFSSRAFSGSVQLRGYLQRVGTRFQTVMRSRPLVEGENVTWVERDQIGSQSVDATVVAVVSHGHIVALTYNDSDALGSPGRLSAAGARQLVNIPSAAWPAGLGLAGLGMLALVFGWPRRKPSPSQLNGRLVVALRRDHQLDAEQEKKAA